MLVVKIDSNRARSEVSDSRAIVGLNSSTRMSRLFWSASWRTSSSVMGTSPSIGCVAGGGAGSVAGDVAAACELGAVAAPEMPTGIVAAGIDRGGTIDTLARSSGLTSRSFSRGTIHSPVPPLPYRKQPLMMGSQADRMKHEILNPKHKTNFKFKSLKDVCR